MKRALRWMGVFVAGLLGIILVTEGLVAAPVTTQLASKGKAVWPVVVAEAAVEETRVAAVSLADMLTRISGATFEVVHGTDVSGIVVGVVDDFPGLTPEGMFDPSDPLRREEYLLQSHEKGVRLIGATVMGVENAVWDLLYRLGFRQFFPVQYGKSCQKIYRPRSPLMFSKNRPI